MTFESSDGSIAAPIDGGGLGSPAGRIGRLVRALRSLGASPWAPVVLRAVAIALVMALLALFGAISMARSFEGKLKLPVLDAQLGAAWLAPDRAPETSAPAPDAGADEHGAVATCDDGGAPAVPGVTADGKVILNTAAVSDLTRLPGVGKRRAEQIVALRARLKRFKKTTDLLRVKGIGVRGLRRMQPHLVLDPPAAPESGAAPVRDGG
jgi:competence ComEA-like helix-hairpin-helix protein